MENLAAAAKGQCLIYVELDILRIGPSSIIRGGREKKGRGTGFLSPTGTGFAIIAIGCRRAISITEWPLREGYSRKVVAARTPHIRELMGLGINGMDPVGRGKCGMCDRGR